MKNKNRIIIAIFITFFIFRYGLAQEKPSFAGLGAGFSIPYSKFRSTNLEDGSFALTGLSVNAEGAWFFKPRIGIGGNAGFNLNPVYVSALAWAKVQDDPFLEDLTIRSDPYLTVTAMVRFYTKIPVYKQIFVTGKLLGGLLYGKTPYQLYKPQYFLAGPSYYEITSAKDWKFSWQAGAGIQYELSPCIGLVIEAVIMYDQLSFNFKTASEIRTDVHTISIINTNFGIRIRI